MRHQYKITFRMCGTLCGFLCGCHHVATRISGACRYLSVAGRRRRQLSIDIYCTRLSSAANQHVAAADDGRTDGHPTVT